MSMRGSPGAPRGPRLPDDVGSTGEPPATKDVGPVVDGAGAGEVPAVTQTEHPAVARPRPTATRNDAARSPHIFIQRD